MKILVLTNLFPNPEEPERGVYVAQLTQEMAPHADVTVVSPLPWFPAWRFLRRFEQWHRFSRIPAMVSRDGISVYYPKYLVIPKLFQSFHSVFMFLSVFFLIRKLHRRVSFDLIHGKWMYPDGVVAAWMGKFLGVPVVLSAHGCDINRDIRRSGIGWQIKRALEYANRVITVSHPLADVIHGQRLRNVTVSTIVNGVDPNRFRQLDRDSCRRELDIDDQEKIILFVGELVDVKGVSTLVEAFRMLPADGNYKLILIGDGDLKESITEQVLSLNLFNRVRFLGWCAHDVVARWMNAADVLCLPSIREGTPNVVLEALASGCPVVATRVGELPYLITENNGLLVPVGDAAALSKALVLAMGTKWDRALIRASVSGRTWKQVAAEYLEVFKETSRSSTGHAPS